MLTKPIFIVASLFPLTLAVAQHGSGNDSRLMFSDEIVSSYKDTAKLVLFHDVRMKGHFRRWEFYSLPNKTMNRRSHCGIDRSWRAQAAPLFCGYLR
jgi:hypothetical protein